MRPTLARLQATLLAAGGALVLGSGLLLSLVLGSVDPDGVYGAPCAGSGACRQRKGSGCRAQVQRAGVGWLLLPEPVVAHVGGCSRAQSPTPSALAAVLLDQVVTGMA